MSTCTPSSDLAHVAHRREYPALEAPCLTCHFVIRWHEKIHSGLRGAASKRHWFGRFLQGSVEADAGEGAVDARASIANAVLEKLDIKSRGQSRHKHRFRLARSAGVHRPSAENEAHGNDDHAGGTRSREDSICLPRYYFGDFGIDVIVEINDEYLAVSFRASCAARGSLQCDPSTKPHTSQAHETISLLEKGDLDDDDQIDARMDSIFSDFWDRFFEHVSKDENRDHRAHLFDNAGVRTAEIQGLVLKYDWCTNLDKDERKAAREDWPERIIDLESKNAIAKNARTFANTRPNSLLRILGFGRPVDSESIEEYCAGNAVLCRFFGKKVVYGSSLSETNKVHRFFILYGGPSPYQISRLIMLGYHSAELRFASLFDWPLLVQASDRMRELDRMLSDNRIRDAGKKVREIWQLGPDGFSYRVTQCRHYTARLNKALQALRVRRIVGWQSYDGFIRRNVAPQVDFVDALGQRFDALQAQLRQQRLVDLQEKAEWFAMAAATYYLGSVVGVALYSIHGFEPYLLSACAIAGLACESHGPPVDIAADMMAAEHKNEMAHLIGFAAVGLPLFFFAIFRALDRRGSAHRASRGRLPTSGTSGGSSTSLEESRRHPQPTP